ncbi:Phosphate-selective porin O and P [Botrimarina mediterranea]|uniref:Phosphate-selective porin O and P n=1 Tax=Botrimarina mediterranea TaxID=2528022 RepID=A0A518KDX0_9BACT|nr:Phosphate-selective porin O and P [Botrimarina mediterranea]
MLKAWLRIAFASGVATLGAAVASADVGWTLEVDRLVAPRLPNGEIRLLAAEEAVPAGEPTSGGASGSATNDETPAGKPPSEGSNGVKSALEREEEKIEEISRSADEYVADIEKRLKSLESDHSELRTAHNTLKDDFGYLVTSGHSKSTMQLFGRLHFDAWGFPGDSPGVNGFETGDPNVSPQDRLTIRRLRFGAEGDLPGNMLYRLDLELAGGNETEFRDVYLGWKELPVFQELLIGNQKRPYGLDHINSSRYNVFMERPSVIEAFNQDNRRLGIQSWGYTDDLGWNWRYGVFNQRIVQDEGGYVSDHWQPEVAGRLSNTLWWDEASDGRGYIHLAIAGSYANTDQNALTENFAGSGVSEARFRTRPEARTESRWYDTGVIPGADDYELLAFESVVNLGPWQLVGEQQTIWVDRIGAEPVRFHGAYAYLSYFLTGEHVPWDRETGQLDRAHPFENFFLVNTCNSGVASGMGAWQVAARWSYLDTADGDIQGGRGDAITAALNWYWTPYAKWQFNYIYGDITNNDLNAPLGAPNFGDYHILGTRFQVDF